jgi:flagellar hook assembly protein FlgD
MLADGSEGNSNTLEQNSPNPFVVSVSGQTTIGFNLASPENVTLRIIDVLGHEVRALISGEGRTAGYNSITWDGRDGSGNLVPTGMYFYQLTTPDFTQCAKMQVVH